MKNKIDQKWWLVGFNFIEFFDYFIFIHLASIINPNFLGTEISPFFQKCVQFGTVYCVTPLIMLLMSTYADKLGRKRAIINMTFLAVISSIGMFVFALMIDGPNVWIAVGYLLLRFCLAASMSVEPMVAKCYGVEDVAPYQFYKIPYWTRWLTNAQIGGEIFALLLGCSILIFNLTWKLPFYMTPIILIVAFLVRRALSETYEFQSVATKKLHTHFSWQFLFTRFQDNKLYRWRLIRFATLSCSGVAFLTYNITILTPHILSARGVNTDYEVMTHNLYIVVLEFIIGTLFVLMFYRTRLNLVKVQMGSFFFSFALLSALLLLDFTAIPLWVLGLMQASFVSFGLWNLIYGILAHQFPIETRLKSMTLSWAFGRLITFALSIYGFSALYDHFGIMGPSSVAFFFLLTNIISMHYSAYEEYYKPALKIEIR